MQELFSRTELLFGKDGMTKLKNSHVAVFGIGGVGGHTLEALIRSGIGTVTIVDNDVVSLSNLNRQIIATQNTIGKSKVDAAEERMLSINPDLKILKHKIFYTPETASEINFNCFDYVVDAIDTVSGKLEIIMQAKKANVPVISSMGAGNKMHPELFEISDISKTSVCPLAKVIRQELKKRNIKNVKVVYSKEIPIKPDMTEFNKTNFANTQNKKRFPGSNAFVPATVGLIIAGEVIRFLIDQ